MFQIIQLFHWQFYLHRVPEDVEEIVIDCVAQVVLGYLVRPNAYDQVGTYDLGHIQGDGSAVIGREGSTLLTRQTTFQQPEKSLCIVIAPDRVRDVPAAILACDLASQVGNTVEVFALGQAPLPVSTNGLLKHFGKLPIESWILFHLLGDCSTGCAGDPICFRCFGNTGLFDDCPLLVGSIFGVAAGTAALGEAVEAALVGVYDQKKVASQALAVGDKIYEDNTAKNMTKTLTSAISASWTGGRQPPITVLCPFCHTVRAWIENKKLNIIVFRDVTEHGGRNEFRERTR